ncbi:hypothetical protein G6F56_014377 [Rhizopus delemar]|nr:hypothetical protein G6F56_014377 [Rhizopus delemar]
MLPGEEDFLVIPCKLLNKCEFLGLYLDASVPFDERDKDEDLTGTEACRGDGLTSEHKLDDNTFLALAATFATESC